MLVEIPAASQVPTKFKNIAYMRVGSATPKIADHPGHEASLLAKLRPFVWEQGVAKSFVSTEDVIRLLDVATYFKLTEQVLPVSDEAIAVVLAHDKLIAKDVGGRWNILNLGAMLFAHDSGNSTTSPERRFAWSNIAATRAPKKPANKSGSADTPSASTH